MGDTEIKDKILKLLKKNKDWMSTNRISVQTAINFYRVERILYKLFEENKIEKDEKPDTIYWKKANQGY